MIHILSGEKIAQEILKSVKKRIRRAKLSLAVVQVGRNLVSAKYIGEKEKVARFLNIGFRVFRSPASIAQAKLEQSISQLGRDTRVSGMIVQLPLPKHLKTQQALDCIPLKKDVDVLSSESFGKLALGQLNILPPTVGAVKLLLEKAKVNLKGTKVLVVGAGRLVGLPLTFWLLQQGATLSVANQHTRNLTQLAKQADILISGVGKTRLIQGNMVKKGVVVIDAGTSVEGGYTKGDVDFKSVSKKASFITPVPGGVGPLTVACLFQNLIVVQKG